MNDVKSVRFRRDQVSVLNGNNCPLSAGFSVRNRRNMQIYGHSIINTGLACIIIALMIMFRLTHYAHFYAPSYFFWIEVILMVVGLISLVQPLAFLFVFNSTIGAFVLLSGSAISFISLFWPVKEHHSQNEQKIDDLLPDYSFNEFYEVWIKASPEKVKQTLQVTGVQDIPVVHFLMKIRGISDGKDMSDTAAKSQVGTGNFSTPDFNFFVVDPTEYISVMIIKSSMITNKPDKPAPPEIFTLKKFISFKNPGCIFYPEIINKLIILFFQKPEGL